MSTSFEVNKLEHHLSSLRAPSPASSRKSVLSWIDNLSPPSVNPASAPVAITSTRKRKRASSHPTLNDRALRPRQQGPAANAMSAKPLAMGGETGRRQARPKVSRGQASKETAIEEKARDVEIGSEDVEATPRPVRGRQLASNAPPMQASSEDSSSRSAQSPTKMTGMKNLSTPHGFIVVKGIRSIEEGHPLDKEKLLWKDLHRYSRGLAVLPRSMMSIRDRSGEVDEFELDMIFDATDVREELGQAPQFEAVEDIQEATRECLERQDHEPGWNSFVHGPMLRMARTLSRHSKHVGVANITTARIDPKSLASQRTNGTVIKGKIVDFAIVLQPSDRLDEGFKNLEPLQGSNAVSYNQTTDSIIADRPLAVSIETKPQGTGLSGGLVQLSTWTSAQYRRLNLLAKACGVDADSVAMPILPLLLVEGATWTLYAATLGAKGPVLWQLWDIGKSSELLGIYRIIAVLQRLMGWAESQYRVWFEANMVPLTEMQKNS